MMMRAVSGHMQHVYTLDFIDWWDGWTPYEEMLAKRILDEAKPNPDLFTSHIYSSKDLQEQLLMAVYAVSKVGGWDGDITQGPFVSGLPMPDTKANRELDTVYEEGRASALMFGWKHRNNGMTFICSPVPLPWLDGGCYDETQDEE